MPSPYKFGVTADNYPVGKRHCRLLHRPLGLRQETAVPSPYKFGVTADNYPVGKRHCRLLHLKSAVAKV